MWAFAHAVPSTWDGVPSCRGSVFPVILFQGHLFSWAFLTLPEQLLTLLIQPVSASFMALRQLADVWASYYLFPLGTGTVPSCLLGGLMDFPSTRDPKLGPCGLSSPPSLAAWQETFVSLGNRSHRVTAVAGSRAGDEREEDGVW